MRELRAFNFKKWIDEHRHLLEPPVGNKLVFPDAEFIVMVVGGPNQRKDYHVDEGEEFFYQLEGDMVLKTMQGGQPVDVPIAEGEIFLLPPRLPHSPQRLENTVGLVIERQRHAHEKDGLQWYCDDCHHLLYGFSSGIRPLLWERRASHLQRMWQRDGHSMRRRAED